MKRNLLFVVLVIAFILASCIPVTTTLPPTTGETPVVEPTKEVPVCDGPIKIGIIGAMTGTNAVLGAWMTKGVTLAIEEKNLSGGVHGCLLQLLVFDDAGDATKSVEIAQKVATESGVMAVFATTNSGTALVDIPIFEQFKIPQFTNGTNVTITQQGSAYIFRVCPAGPAYEDPIVEFLLAEGFKKFAIIGDNVAYGKGEAEYQTAALARAGNAPLVYEQHGADDTDFAAQITKVKDSGAEVLLIASSEVAAGLIVKQAREMGFTGVIAGGSALSTTKFIETAGAASEGVYFTSGYPGNDANEQTRKFSAAYTARWGEVAELHGANTYDGTSILLIAMENAFPLTPENVAIELHKICGYQGLQGEFCYDETGEGLKKTNMGQIQNGKGVFLP